jgi:uncharacterized membrane protein YjjP (DUF1212 family)
MILASIALWFVYMMYAYWALIIHIILFACFSSITIKFYLTGYGARFRVVTDWIIALFIPFILLSISIILGVIPYVAFKKSIIYSNEQIKINPEPIIESFEKIKEHLSGLEIRISEESKNIDNLVIIMIKEIELQNKELEETRIKVDRLSQQVEYFRDLADLTEDEAKLVIKALERDKYRDILIGFGIGLFFCVIGLILQWIFFGKSYLG